MTEKKPDKDKENNTFSSLTIPEIDGSSLTSLMHRGIGLESPFMKEIYLRKQPIVGTRFLGGSDALVDDLEVGSRITFLREQDNAYDPYAIMALDEQGRKLGYIPRRENQIIGALMAAGKYFYGIITEKPEGDYYGNRTPGSIWMDLYMREFALPDDLSEIPLQGYRGSYAVLDLVFADWEDLDYPDKCKGVYHKERYLSDVYAIKVIHGEEKSSFRLTFDPDDRRAGRDFLEESGDETERSDPLLDMDRTSDYEQMITDLDHFLGHLSLVVHDISEEDLSALREDYGMILGKTLSNHIIDTRQMAENHIPFIRDYSVNGLADHLGIDIHLDDPCEKRCRIIWQLYQRMERSELEKKTDSLVAEDLMKTYKSVVRWIEYLRRIETDSETREGMIDFIGFGEDICKAFDDLHHQAIDFTRIMKKYYNGDIDKDGKWR